MPTTITNKAVYSHRLIDESFMTRISKYQLNKDIEKEIFFLFWTSLTKLKIATDMAMFFADLLSDTEEIMLAKRFAIALLLKRGKKPIEIARILHVSFSMIRSVNEWITHASPSTMTILKSAQTTQTFEFFFDTLNSLLDKQLPRRGTNWHKAGKEKWKQEQERLARSRLR